MIDEAHEIHPSSGGVTPSGKYKGCLLYPASLQHCFHLGCFAVYLGLRSVTFVFQTFSVFFFSLFPSSSSPPFFLHILFYLTW